MKDEPFLSIIIPARNEEENIAGTIDNLLKYINKSESEIIVVDDHSIDRTGKVVERMKTKFDGLKLIKNTDDPGFANALKAGFAQARGKYVLPVMADGCDDPATIELMLEKAKRGYDLVCGCRYMKGGGKSGGPVFQNFFSKFVCISLYYLAGLPTRDVSNAFKLYRREILQKIELKEKGFAVSMEAALSFYFSGYSICDVPTIWQGRKKGRSKFKISKTLPYVKLYLNTMVKRWKK